MWIVISAAVVILAAAGIAIPLLVRANGDDTSSTTGSVTTATTVVSGTTVSTAPPSTTPVTSPETTTTTAGGGTEWAEVDIPGGPWTANDVAVSDEAVLLNTSTGTTSKLTAVMLDSGDVIELTEAEAMWGMDIDGDVAVWWEGAAFDDAAARWTEQHIYSFHLPDGPRNEITAGGAGSIGSPQVALPYVTWVESAPWADSPDEYWAERILMAQVDSNGAPAGAVTEMVPIALASMLGDSGWQYSLSRTCLAWENGDAAGGDVGTSVIEIDTDTHGSIGAEAWRPSLWRHTLVYYDNGLKITDLSVGGTHSFADDGDFPTAGPDFAAYYRMVDGGGTEIVARAYDGSYEQVLGTNPDPPWFCLPISVSPGYIAFTTGNEVHLFKWS